MRENVGKLIGDKIRAILAEQGKTQAWLSDHTGIQRGYLSELMNGHPKKRWNADTLNKVAVALDVPKSAIMPDDGQEKQKSLIQVLEESKLQFADDQFLEPLASALIAALKQKENNKI